WPASAVIVASAKHGARGQNGGKLPHFICRLFLNTNPTGGRIGCKKCESIPIPTLKGRNRTAQGVSPGVRHGKAGSSPERATQSAPPLQGSIQAARVSGLTPWAVLLDPFRVPQCVLPGLAIPILGS